VTDFLKPSRRLQDLLEEPSYLAAGEGLNGALAVTETQTFQADLGDATTAITLSRTTNKTAVDGVVVDQTTWIPTNTPEVSEVVNAALADAAKLSLTSESTITVSGPNGETRFGALLANLEVTIFAPVSRTAGGCIHPSKVIPCKGEITALAGDDLTVKFSFPNAEGYRVAGTGKALLHVTNLKQRVRSAGFEVEIV